MEAGGRGSAVAKSENQAFSRGHSFDISGRYSL